MGGRGRARAHDPPAECGHLGGAQHRDRRGRGRLIAFLDSDDLWMPGYAAEMSAALDREPEAGFAHTDAWLSRGGQRAHPLQRHLARLLSAPARIRLVEEVLLSLLETNFVMSSTTCRADALATVGGYAGPRDRRLGPVAAHRLLRPAAGVEPDCVIISGITPRSSRPTS